LYEIKKKYQKKEAAGYQRRYCPIHLCSLKERSRANKAGGILMQKVKENMNSIVVCFLEIVLGMLLLIKPVGFTITILITFGVLLIVAGIGDIIKYFRLEAQEASKSQRLFKGIILVLTGIFFTCKYQWFLATFPVVTVIYGVFLLVTGIFKIQWTVDAFRLKKNKWYLPAISAAITIVCAVVILKNPFSSMAALWIFNGTILIVEAVFDLIAIFFGNQEQYII